jgi:hypothetical protein
LFENFDDVIDKDAHALLIAADHLVEAAVDEVIRRECAAFSVTELNLDP